MIANKTVNTTIVLVAGPTASGKSAHALHLAKARHGCLINADAAQIYAGVPILSAQPDARSMAEAPHVLYGYVGVDQLFSVGRWLLDARAAIESAIEAKQTPIIVGGTGLYFKALMEGMADIPQVPLAVREKVAAMYHALGPEKFRHELARVDGESAARILPNDQQRLCRAREVFEATQTPLSMWQKNKQHQPPPHWQFEKILLWPDRGTLYQRCDDRFLQMLAQGAVHEVTTLLSANIPTRAGVRKIIGVREIENYLAGNITLNEATALAQQATRHYAKRQYTWFRQQWPATTRVNI
ncbi:MAG: tRNA (adenosine(37)-N6)-dimethylallyltransferase MiaA [Alphaproteobacteria bacterium]|nr:tRNA (adenosine(37)-N6)-dimethylallyltransferase MiaA [Alphaproteobacteria bacterium]NDC55974.1 tRNA (adenosine(37)-N6)-dimethylallyltransferase MiaA [Alphaproteobacteria bacterium]